MKFDIEKNTDAQFFELLMSKSKPVDGRPALTYADLDFSTPEPIEVDEFGNNTQMTITARTSSKHYTGSKVVKYRRVDIADSIDKVNTKFKVFEEEIESDEIADAFHENNSHLPYNPNYLVYGEKLVVDDDDKACFGEIPLELTPYGDWFVHKVRDAKIHLHGGRHKVNVIVRWKAVWNADSNKESVYVLDSYPWHNEIIEIPEDSLNGESDIITVPVGRSVTIVFPGYSYRNYELVVSESVDLYVEPTKVHFSSTLPANTTLYFTQPADTTGTFNIKHYASAGIDAVTGATLTRLSDDHALDIDATPKTRYYEFDTLELPKSTDSVVWRVDLKGQGRAGFWLDGMDNYFSYEPLPECKLSYEPTGLYLSPNETPGGKVAKLGIYLPYSPLSEQVRQAITAMNPACFNMYVFADTLTRNPGIEVAFRNYPYNDLGISRDWNILAKSGRVPVLDHAGDTQVQEGLGVWLDMMADMPEGEHFIAPADEPNLNYPDYESFEAHFVSFANHVRSHEGASAKGVRIAAPSSSRFDHGTTVDGALERKGEKWLARLVENHPDLVDGITWHEWTNRDLLNTRYFAETVERAYAYSDSGRRRLCLEQTNTSGGESVSLYQQNTSYAATWWAAAYIAACSTGKLDDIMWFPVFDEIDHPKGLMSNEGEVKVIGEFYTALSREMNDDDVELLSGHEVDDEVSALFYRKDGVNCALVVNKVNRIANLNYNDDMVYRIVGEDGKLSEPVMTDEGLVLKPYQVAFLKLYK